MVRNSRSVAMAVLVLSPRPTFAGERGSIRGEYVEARTAEVFAGRLHHEQRGRDRGTAGGDGVAHHERQFDGVALDGLTVVAAVAGDRNLGMREMGGEEPHDSCARW